MSPDGPGTGKPAASGLDRLSRAALAVAARRWPADLSQVILAEWLAELDAVRADARLGAVERASRTIAFAGSIALSPAVEAEGAEAMTWQDRATAAGRPVAAAIVVTLLAAALFNAVHTGYHQVGSALSATGGAVIAIATLVVAAAIMAAMARCAFHPASRPGRRAVGRTALLGVAFAMFFLAGNRVAVMPFMGWIDIIPAVIAWSTLTATAAGIAARLTASGHRALGLLAGIGGGLLALDAATIMGSLHAADALGLGLGSAPAWFPLALLPGGTTDFGAYFGDGTAAFGSLQATGPAFHASAILLGNMSAMAGPLLLGSVFVLTQAIREGRRPASRAPVAYPGLAPVDPWGSPVSRDPGRPPRPRWWSPPRAARDLRIPLGVAGTLVSLIACEWVRRSAGTDTGAPTLHRLLENSNVFGFGFLAHTPGRVAVALLAGLLLARLGETTHRPQTR